MAFEKQEIKILTSAHHSLLFRTNQEVPSNASFPAHDLKFPPAPFLTCFPSAPPARWLCHVLRASPGRMSCWGSWGPIVGEELATELPSRSDGYARGYFSSSRSWRLIFNFYIYLLMYFACVACSCAHTCECASTGECLPRHLCGGWRKTGLCFLSCLRQSFFGCSLLCGPG